MASKAYDVITDRILEKLRDGVVPWHKPWNAAEGAPKNLISKKPYHGVNVFMLGCQGGSPWWLTYKQAQALGGQVRKGERGTPIVFWKTFEDENEDGTVDKCWMLRYSTVFNLNQIDGIEAPKIEGAPEPKTVEPLAAAETLVADMPGCPEIKHGGSRACYSPSSDEVRMPERDSFDGSKEYYSTLFHELVHSTGHESRLSRAGVTSATFFGSADYSREELVAEMGAAFLCGEVGIENRTIDNSAAYIASWMKRLHEDSTLVVIAAAQGSKAAKFILGEQQAEEVIAS